MTTSPLEPREHHDGTGWQLKVTYADTTARCEIQRQLPDETWVTAQQWHVDDIDNRKQRRHLITTTARDHGWITPDGRWPRTHRDGTCVIGDIFPFLWRAIVADATAFRAQALRDAAAADTAWRHAVVAAQDLGGLSAPDLAAVTGLTKHAIYAINTDTTINVGNIINQGRKQ